MFSDLFRIFFICFGLGGLVGCQAPIKLIEENTFNPDQLAEFVEPNFPILNTALDNDSLGEPFPSKNQVPRALAIFLGNKAYLGFDRDLLRWSVAWNGDFTTLTTVAQVSYKDFFSKADAYPKILGQAALATGTYPGWTNYKPDFLDPRNNQNENDLENWGPLPLSIGEWKGVYTINQQAVLHYEVGKTKIYELPGSYVFSTDHLAYTRSLKVDASKDTLYAVLAEFDCIERTETQKDQLVVYLSDSNRRVSSLQLLGISTPHASLSVEKNKYLVLTLFPQQQEREFTVVMWSGDQRKLVDFQESTRERSFPFPEFLSGGSPYWKETVYTKGVLARDTSAFVMDYLTLPLPNPWKRNLRVADIAFTKEGKAAVVTFDGDVWIVNGINQKLDKLSWTRFASGIFEPMSILIQKETLHVFGRDGITKLIDLNNDGVADYYENFSPLIIQSMETREWPADMVQDDKGYFYIAKGGGTILNHKTESNQPESGYNAASAQAGTVSKISPDGRSFEIIATGLRAPYLGIHPVTEMLTVSDQQGNFVPATPIYEAKKGDFFGVLPSAHANLFSSHNLKSAKKPLTWIPHHIDRSSISQVWITSDKMGPLNNTLVHFSFGRTGLFSVLIDSASRENKQAGVLFIDANYTAPVLKGAIHPKDGQLYTAGFNLWGSNSTGISAIGRLRYTGRKYQLPTGFQVGKEGLVLHFSEELERESVKDLSNFVIKRWNYQRSARYGSGHYLLNGSPGEETLPILQSHLSADKKSLLLLIANMEEVMQMQLRYAIESKENIPLVDVFSFSVNRLNSLHLQPQFFPSLDLEKVNLQLTAEQLIEARPKDQEISKEKGETLFKQFACLGCHSTTDRTEGMYGTPFGNLFLSKREFKDGSSALADEQYLRESILSPNKQIVKGYGDEMPSFSGILSPSDVESLILYIKTL